MSKKDAFKIFQGGISAILSKNVIKQNVKLEDSTLTVGNSTYDLDSYNNLYLYGAGKASIDMAAQCEKILKKRVSGGFVVGTKDEKLKRVEAYISDHPVPTKRSIEGGTLLKEKMLQMGEKDLFIFLLSGGASSLIEVPKEPLTLKDLKKTTKVLLQSGGDINGVNVIRKALSQIKGGGLVRGIKADGTVLVISDVMGDKLETIGSAPMYGGGSVLKRDVEKVLETYPLEENLPDVAAKMLKGYRGIGGRRKNYEHFIVGNNAKAVEGAWSTAESLGYSVVKAPFLLEGEAKIAAKRVAEYAKRLQKKKDIKLPLCLLVGGETTVTIKGKGKGGRNQEFVTVMMGELKDHKGISYLSGGTDGIDGNSTAAGGYGDSKLYQRSLKKSLKIEKFLNRNDSNSFLNKIDGLIETGYTGTNVADIAVILIDKR